MTEGIASTVQLNNPMLSGLKQNLLEVVNFLMGERIREIGLKENSADRRKARSFVLRTDTIFSKEKDRIRILLSLEQWAEILDNFGDDIVHLDVGLTKTFLLYLFWYPSVCRALKQHV